MSLKSSGGNKYVTSKNYSAGISRTKVANIFEFRTTFKAGYLLPLWCDEVYPGETKSINCGELVRSITPLGPTMDRSFLDIFFFFVPYRIVWDHWEEFIAGYNKEAWTQDVVYNTPQIKFKAGVYNAFKNKGEETEEEDTGCDDPNKYIGSFLDYLPGACDVCELRNLQRVVLDNHVETNIVDETTLNDVLSISALYPRAYVKIWNDWFRDENLQDELQLYTGDNDEYADEFAFNLLNPSLLPKAAKYHNRFTSCLPSPVKGPDVLIPMNNLSINGNLPVGYFAPATGTLTNNAYFASELAGASLTEGNFYKGKVGTPGLGSGTFPELFANSSGVTVSNTSNTIRMLRLATQTELLLARDARGGTRYVESLLSHFGVHNGDARLQRSEYLGSRQIPLYVTQITNTAQSDSTPLGNVGGQSVNKDNAHYFTKSFSEHGVVFMLATVRTNISYSSGVRKQYQRKGRFDYIWPEFKHIGDVPCYTKEVEINEPLFNNLPGGVDSPNDLVFGYTPYGSELREGYNFNNGLFRHKATGSLDYLTYQEKYDEDTYPVLSDSWIQQPNDIVSDTLVYQEGPQYYALFELHQERVIPLDPTSDPGLMDHF